MEEFVVSIFLFLLILSIRLWTRTDRVHYTHWITHFYCQSRQLLHMVLIFSFLFWTSKIASEDVAHISRVPYSIFDLKKQHTNFQNKNFNPLFVTGKIRETHWVVDGTSIWNLYTVVSFRVTFVTKVLPSGDRSDSLFCMPPSGHKKKKKTFRFFPIWMRARKSFSSAISIFEINFWKITLLWIINLILMHFVLDKRWMLHGIEIYIRWKCRWL